jgi:hypothetical protein
MSLTCTLGLVSCVTIAGITLPYSDAEKAFNYCFDAENIPLKQFGMVRDPIVRWTGSDMVPGDGDFKMEWLYELGFKELKYEKGDTLQRKRTKFLSLCRRINRDFRYKE